MADRSQPGVPAPPPAADPFSLREKLLWAAALLLVYSCFATWGQFDFSNQMGYYDLLADGLLAGHLYIPQTPQQGFLLDMIPYRGHYYLQWGPFPAVLHLGVRVFGGRLSDRVATLLAACLAALVFLETIAVLRERYFPAVSKAACRWFLVAFALGTPNFLIGVCGSVYHESIAIASLAVLAGLLAFLRYVERPSGLWVLAAGAALAIALATRITQVLYAAGIGAGLLALHWRMRRPLRSTAAHLVLFALPVLVSGLLMMAYNQARFHSPWEYGFRYLPTTLPQRPAPFSLRRMPENFLHYVLAPIRFRREPPWIYHWGWPPATRTWGIENMSSLFLASPFLLLGALAWKLFRDREPRLAPVRLFTAVVAASALLQFLTLLAYWFTSRRFLQDFVPELTIVAFIGFAAYAESIVSWRRWRAAAWVVLIPSVLLHLHLAALQALYRYPRNPDLLRTFVEVSPVVRHFLPSATLARREAKCHRELGAIYLEQHRYAEAAQQFRLAGQVSPAP